MLAARLWSDMPKISLQVPHHLGEQEAVRRLTGFVEQMQERHREHLRDFDAVWNGNSLACTFAVSGFRIRGDLTVGAAEVDVGATLPLAAVIFRGRIEKAIRDELGGLLC